jgi:hypothetical protein
VQNHTRSQGGRCFLVTLGRPLISSFLITGFPMTNALAQSQLVEFSTYYPGKHFLPQAGPAEPEFLAISSMSEWTKVWDEMHPRRTQPQSMASDQNTTDAQRSGQEAPPLIDFKQYTLLAAAIGQQSPSEAHSVTFMSIREDK